MVKPNVKPRSWMQQSAKARPGAGAHADRRDKRRGGRKERRDRAARDGW